HDPQRIRQQGAVGGMVNVSFYGSGIGAQLLSGNDSRLDGLLHDPLVDLLSAFLAKERKSPTQIAKIWNRVLVKAGKASIQKAGAQFPVKLTIRPTFNVLKHQTTQQPIRSNPFPASSAGSWAAGGQDLRA